MGCCGEERPVLCYADVLEHELDEVLDELEDVPDTSWPPKVFRDTEWEDEDEDLPMVRVQLFAPSDGDTLDAIADICAGVHTYVPRNHVAEVLDELEHVEARISSLESQLEILLAVDGERPSLDLLEARVRQWCETVGLPADPHAQLRKVREEVEELEKAYVTSPEPREDMAEELGDVQVTLFALARALDTTTAHATRPVIEKIEQRAEEGGAIVDGQYVKEADLKEEGPDDA